VYATTALAGMSGETLDVVLSSGFLAFANHSGFLQAVEEVRARVPLAFATRARGTHSREQAVRV
jgi:hypothetical protein